MLQPATWDESCRWPLSSLGTSLQGEMTATVTLEGNRNPTRLGVFKLPCLGFLSSSFPFFSRCVIRYYEHLLFSSLDNVFFDCAGQRAIDGYLVPSPLTKTSAGKLHPLRFHRYVSAEVVVK